MKSEFAEFNAQCRKEQSWIKCMEDYLTDSIAPLYKSADISVPTVVLVCYNCDDSTNMCFWCDYWVFNYNICSDTLMTVSGGNHPGLMTLKQESDLLRVVSFEQAEDGTGHDESLHRIFDDCYVYYEMKKEDGNYPEEYRKKSIAKYALQYNLTINYYKDYGWDAVRIDNQ